MRALASKTRDMALRIVGRLLTARFGDDAIDIAAIKPEHVRRFFALQAELYRKPCVRCLRSLTTATRRPTLRTSRAKPATSATSLAGPGIGALAASALVASIADAKSFDNGRQLSAWLGLVPRQHSKYAPGGGESLCDMAARVQPWVREVAAFEADVLAVTHGGVMRLLTAWVSSVLDTPPPTFGQVLRLAAALPLDTHG